MEKWFDLFSKIGPAGIISAFEFPLKLKVKIYKSFFTSDYKEINKKNS